MLKNTVIYVKVRVQSTSEEIIWHNNLRSEQVGSEIMIMMHFIAILLH